MLRSGNPISSAQAKEYGLVQEEVNGDMIEAAIDWVRKIVTGSVSVPAIPRGPLPVPSKLAGGRYRSPQP